MSLFNNVIGGFNTMLHHFIINDLVHIERDSSRLNNTRLIFLLNWCLLAIEKDGVENDE